MIVSLLSEDGGNDKQIFLWESMKEEQVMSASVQTGNAEKYAELLQNKDYLMNNHIYAIQETEQGEVSMLFAGDILFDDEYAVMANAINRGGRVEDVFSAELLEEMRGADILMVNNEFPYTNRGVALENKQFTFRADTETVSWLNDMGVDVVSLANNHAFDFGEIGLLDTFETLETVGMPYVGAGRNIEEASAPVFFMTGNLKIGILSATQIERLDHPDTRGAGENVSGVFRCWNPQLLYETIQKTKAECDFLVVFIHWGTENTDELDWAQLDQAPKLAESGADLIIGAHPHCLQGIDYVGNVPVIYSLGNFWFNSKSLDTGMIEAVIDENGIKSLKFLPAKQEDCRTTLLEGEEKERVLNVMQALSNKVIVDNEGIIKSKE